MVSMKLPALIQYGVKIPFRVTVVGQTDNGKTHSIIRRWLGSRISFWKYINGESTMCQLQHCLYCSNGGMSNEEKQRFKDEFIDRVGTSKRLFHLNGLPSKKELFKFITSTSEIKQSKKEELHKCGASIGSRKEIEQIVLSENENNSPNRVVIMDDLTIDAFNSRDKEVTSTMNL